jgi:hypothetical protein
MMARKAESYAPDTYVIDLAELRQIIFEIQISHCASISALRELSNSDQLSLPD